MAAIYGIYARNRNGPVHGHELEKMAGSMKHRGRAEGRNASGTGSRCGLLCSGRSAANATKAFRRAPDVEAVVDGEIFNLHSLLGDPQCLVRSDYSNTSTQIAKFYHDENVSFLSQLNGYFAIAIVDKIQHSLVLARDRYGARPLYFYEDGERVIFASEIKAIYSVVKERLSADVSLLPEYLTFRYVFGNSTMFSGVKQVLPGQYMVWSGTKKIAREYWTALSVLKARKSLDSECSVDEVEHLLKQSIVKTTKGASQIGCNCSGGIDSGLLTALTSSATGQAIDSFTIGFKEKTWDERSWAAQTANKYATNHQELEVNSSDFAAVLNKLNWYNDEPLSDPSSVLLYLLGKYSKDKLDVLLTGEGADEVFLGYPRYNLFNVYANVQFLSASIKSLIVQGLRLMGSRRMRKVGSTLSYDYANAIMFNSAFVDQETVKRILDPEVYSLGFPCRQRLLEELQVEIDPVNKLMLYETRTYLPSSLTRLNKMNMAVGLVTATPFLDNELFEYALQVPKTKKLSLLQNKCILRRLASRYLPGEVLRMPKSGFGVPIAEWFAKDATLKDIIHGMTDDTFMQQVISRDEVSGLIRRHVGGICDHAEILWLLTNVYMWHQEYFK
ncbi:MAG: asparagine synthase (glutamine-hydrolyzing) [Nitrososphaera sp.]|nr:asparagine synthase (glutamine-hydrolyzing) [Nitrososphaera sp.]